MKKSMLLLILVVSCPIFARFDIDHAQLASRCPNNTTYKIIEVNRENKTTTYACLSNKNAKSSGHTYKVANWKKGNFLLEEKTPKTTVKFTYANNGSIVRIRSAVTGTQFQDNCDYQDGKSNSHCNELKKLFDKMIIANKTKTADSFCTPNLDEATCTRYDGVKLVPANETYSGMERFIYEVENGLMIQSDVETINHGQSR